MESWKNGMLVLNGNFSFVAFYFPANTAAFYTSLAHYSIVPVFQNSSYEQSELRSIAERFFGY
jgi:hypothetical protein